MDDENNYYFASVESEADDINIVNAQSPVVVNEAASTQEESVPEDPSLPDGDYFSVKVEKAPAPQLIGIVMETRTDGLLAVSALKPDSPAAKCQAISIGDLIISINKTWTLRMSKRTVVSLVRAVPVGSKVTIRLCRPRSNTDIVVPKSRLTRQYSMRTESPVTPTKLYPALTDEEKIKFYEDLENAILSGNLDLVITTISRHFEHSADLMREASCDPLHLAISKGLDDIVIFLVGQNVLDLNRYGNKFDATPLYLATRHNYFSIVEILIDNGAEQNERLSDVTCPLHLAIRLGHIDIAKVLAAHHPELKDGSDQQAEHYLLYLAVSYCQIELLKFWWSRSIDADAVVRYDDDGSDGEHRVLLAVAFHNSSIASKNKSKQYREVIKFLLSKGAVVTKAVGQACGCDKAVIKYLNGKKESKEPKVNWSQKNLSYVNFDHWLRPFAERIVELNLSINPLTELSEHIPWSMHALESFIMCKCESLTTLSEPGPHTTVLCTRLRKVVISDNKSLTSIPLAWFQISNLVSLNLSNNHIDSLPEASENQRWCCFHLDLLNLSNNFLGSLPNGIAGARSLKRLLLADNCLETFPLPWGCPLLKLDLSHNQLTVLPEGMKRNWGRSLQHLDVSNNRLTAIPTDVCALKRLTFFNLSNNELRSLPAADYWVCKKLQTLNLTNNNLGNSYSGRPRSSSGSSTPLTSWWQKLSTSQSVANLATDGSDRSLSPPNSAGSMCLNPENTIPDWTFPTVFAESINSLYLSRNNLTCVPINVSRLAGLSELDISENPEIHDIPSEFGRLHNLDIIHLTGLDLKSIPNKFNPKKAGFVRTADLLRFLKSKLRGEENYRYMKLIVVGKDGCGKTSLVANLCGRDDVYHKRECAVSRWSWLLEPPGNATRREKRTKTVRCSVWELTGPDLYYPVHQCFMTDQALYIVVIRLDQRSWDIAPWLLTIKARAPKSSVIIVGTRKDLLESLVDDVNAEIKRLERTLAECAEGIPGCPPILRFFAVSNDSVMSEMSQLRATIYHYSDNVVSKIKVPRSYLRLHDTIEQERIRRQKNSLIPVLTESELWNLIQNMGENDIEMRDEEELSKVLKLLNQSGALLYYWQAMKVVDEHWYYLNPSWLGELMLKLTISKRAKRKLLITEAEQILAETAAEWINPSAPDFTHLLEIMQRYELLVLLDETRMLVPSKLPLEGPEMEIQFNGPSMCRLYKMSCTPPGFWSRLIARLHLRYSKVTPTQPKSRSNSGNTGSLVRQRSSTLVRTTSLNCNSFEAATFGGRVEQVFYWAEGLFVRAGQGYLTVQSLRQSNIGAFVSKSSDDARAIEGVVIYWQWQDDVEPSDIPDELYFGVAIDEVDLLISEWFPDVDFGEERVQRYAVCPVCLRSAMMPGMEEPEEQISCFPLESLTAAALQTEIIQCPFHDESDLSLKRLIPDVLLWDIPYLMHFDDKYNDIQIENFLTKGGQGSIFRGRFGEKDIAVKVFYSENNMVTKTEGGTGGPKTLTKEHSIPSQVSLATVYDTRATRTSGRQTEVELPVLFAFQRMRREVVFLSAMNHPCVIRILGAMICPKRPICFALNFAHYGNMARYVADAGRRIRKRKTVYESPASPISQGGSFEAETDSYYGCLIDRTLLYKFAWQTVIALQYLHSKGVLYRDLKAENVLVWSIDPEAMVNIKMSDYGISCYAAPQGTVGTEGTRGYQAPEVLKSMAYDDKADIFSFGMVLYELLSGHIPYFEMTFPEDINRAVKQGKRPSLKDCHINPDFRAMVDLMEVCWSANSTERPSCDVVRETMENLSFVALKQQLTVEQTDPWQLARRLGYSTFNLQRNLSICSTPGSASSFPEDEAETTSATKLLISYPSNVPNCCLITGEREKVMAILDTRKSRFIEKDIPLPEAEPVALCTCGDSMLILNGGAKPYVDTYRCQKDSLMPDYIGCSELDLLKEKEITAACAVRDSNDQGRMYVSLKSGEICVFRTSPSDPNIWQTDRFFNFNFLRNSVTNLTALDDGCRLLISCGNSLFLLDATEMKLLSNTRIFDAKTVDHIVVADDSVWCSSISFNMLARVKTSLLTPTRYVDLEQHGISPSLPNFLAPDSPFLKMLRERGVTAMKMVKDCLWVATSVEGQIFILDIKDGKLIDRLDLPKDNDFSDKQVDGIEVVGESVVTLATYFGLKGGEPSRKSSSVFTPVMLAERRSPKLSDPSSVRPGDSIQKVLIWTAFYANDIRKYEVYWQKMSELESKSTRDKY